MDENNTPIQSTVTKDDDDSGEVVKGLLSLILIIVVAIVLWNTNPNESEHRDCVKEVVTEVTAEYLMDGRFYLPPRELKNLKYHSIGIVSWTSVRQRGKDRIVTFGIFNHVLPLLELQ